MAVRSEALTLADVLIPPVRSTSRALRLGREAALLVGFAGFIAVCAQIAIRLPFTPVPITGQTFAVLVAGGALGAWRGAGALLLYGLVGTVGIPVFAPSLDMTGKVIHFILPWQGTAQPPWELTSGGYIVGFILAAWLAGFVAQRGWDRKPWLLLGMLASNALVYLPGLLWLAYLIASGWVHPLAHKPLGELIPGGSTLDKTLIGGLYPYILGDLVKLYLASLTLPAAWALVQRWRR
ncbi:MAG: biotin transporter BioY [Chloroflexi bacterium]|nr:biotin transporter BioY [Chloroflexota bacterium]